MEWAVLYNNKIATDIYYEFNLAMFFNQKNFRYAVGERNYQAKYDLSKIPVFHL